MVETMKEIRNLNPDQRKAKLEQYRSKLMHVKAMLSSGGSIDDPGQIKDIKRTIARLMTLEREAELGINQ